MSAAVDLDATFRALADPRRRRILHLLGTGSRPPAELADALGVTRPAVSRHLRVLRAAGLVAEAPDPTDGRGKCVTLRAAPLRAVADWATEAAAFWSDQLDAFAAFSHAAEQASPPVDGAEP